MGDAFIADALGVSAHTAAALAEAGVRRRYPPRAYLFMEQDEPTQVYLVEIGLLRIDRLTHSGRPVLHELATPGDLVGELGAVDDSPRSATASTLTDTRLLAIPARDFREVMRTSSDLAMATLTRGRRRLRARSSQLVDATARSASARVAARLLRLVEREGAPGPSVELRLPITQEELGQWAGLSREGTVKGLAELREAGVLETGRRRVHLKDLPALERIATTG